MNGTIVDSSIYAKLKRLNVEKKQLEKSILPFGDCSKELYRIVKLEKKITKLITKL